MQYLFVMQGFQSTWDFNDGFPYLVFFDPGFGPEICVNNFHKIASSRQLHDNA